MNKPARPSWDCACLADHYETGANRAWCGACTEWCYPNDPEMLCSRGYLSVLTEKATRLEEENKRLAYRLLALEDPLTEEELETFDIEAKLRQLRDDVVKARDEVDGNVAELARLRADNYMLEHRLRRIAEEGKEKS